MRQYRLQSIALTLAVIAVSIGLLCGCGKRSQMSNRVIVQNETFTLTGDSVIEDTVFAVAVKPDRIETNITMDRLDSMYGHIDPAKVQFTHGRPWRMRKTRPAMMPEYESDQPLVDALYNMSVERIADAIDNNGRFHVTHNISRLYCSIYLSLAALKPHQSMATLRTLVDKDSIIMQREGQWPVFSDHIGWATAAWEVYKTTGDRQWLAYCKHVIEKTLDINSQVLVDQSNGLIHGAGYTTCDQDRVLIMCGKASVLCGDGPAVRAPVDFPGAVCDHRFDRQRHAGLQPDTSVLHPVIRDFRILMHPGPDPVTYQIPHDAEASLGSVISDGPADIVQVVARLRVLQSFKEGLPGHIDQVLCFL